MFSGLPNSISRGMSSSEVVRLEKRDGKVLMWASGAPLMLVDGWSSWTLLRG